MLRTELRELDNAMAHMQVGPIISLCPLQTRCFRPFLLSLMVSWTWRAFYDWPKMQESRGILVGHLHAVEGAARAAAAEGAKAAADMAAAHAAAAAVADMAAAQAAARIAAAEGRQQEAAAKQLRVESRGTNYWYTLANDDASAEFKKRCGTHQSFASVKHITFSGAGDGFFLSRDNGRSYWTRLPTGLTNSLLEEGRNIQGELRYAVGGANGEYYAEMSGGEVWWGGVVNDRFNVLVRDKNRTISRVAFGPDESWIIVFANGKIEWHGIPQGMVDAIRGAIRDHHIVPTEVSLGANESYYMKFADGRYEYHLQLACRTKYERLTQDGHSVTNVIPSPGGSVSSWLIRY